MAGLTQHVVGRDCAPLNQNAPRARISGSEHRPAGRGEDSNQIIFARLARTIEGEIIPRLMLAHMEASAHRDSRPVAAPQPSADDVAELVRIVLTHDVAVATAYVEVFHSQGVALETLFLDLLAPAARLLGDLWKDDLCEFTDVTIGLSRLQQVLRVFSPTFESGVECMEEGQRILLVPAPGEQHTFGLTMVEEFFRRAGWDVASDPPSSRANDVTEVVRSERFAVVGFSLSCETRFEALAATIRSVRRASRNKGIRVLVGRRVFTEHPDLFVVAGADATAVDARQAIVQARGLLGSRQLAARVGATLTRD